MSTTPDDCLSSPRTGFTGGGRAVRCMLAGLAALVFLTAAPAAQATGTSEIKGLVTNNASTPAALGGICVSAQSTTGGAGGSTTTSSVSGQVGTYTIGSLSAGSYKVQFFDCQHSVYVTQYWNNQPNFQSATVITLTAGQVQTGINAKLVQGAQIKGTVTNNATTPVPLGGICVSAQPTTPGGAVFGATTSSASGQVGTYTIGPLPAGSYKVLFADCQHNVYVSQWWNNQPFSSATVITLTAGQVQTGINAKMVVGAQIKGTVTNNASTPAPLGGICVQAQSTAPGGPGGSTQTSSVSGQVGTYTIAALPAGTYKVQFFDCQHNVYVPQFWNNQPSFQSATVITLATGQVQTGINAKMVVGAQIKGTVTNNASTPAPLGGICVQAQSTTPSGTGGFTQTSSTSGQVGTYTIGALPAGSYKVQFTDCQHNVYVTQWWNNQPGISSATVITLTAGQVQTGINAKMVPGAQIKGTVTNNASTPAPLGGICVFVQSTTSGGATGFTQTSSVSGQAGTYTIGALPAGTYKVQFSDCQHNVYVTQFWNNQPNFSSATAITLTTGQVQTGINAKMVPGAQIKGTVTNNASTPVPLGGMCVAAFLSGSPVANTTTSSQPGQVGTYTLGPLPAGTYKVQFTDCGSGHYVTQWWNDAASFTAATSIPLTAGQVQTGINAKMVPTGH